MKRSGVLTSGGRGRSGQSIYEIMLIVSCVALGLAIFFPTYEFFELYRGEVRPHKFEAAGGPAIGPSAPVPATPAAPGQTPPARRGGAPGPARPGGRPATPRPSRPAGGGPR